MFHRTRVVIRDPLSRDELILILDFQRDVRSSLSLMVSLHRSNDTVDFSDAGHLQEIPYI